MLICARATKSNFRRGFKVRRALILGAGISGLSLAWYLRNQCEVTLVEAAERPGGWIRTYQHEGFLFEGGPHSFRASGHGAATLALIEELGLTPQLIAACATEQFLLYKNVLHKVPKTLFSLLTSPLTRDLVPALWREWRIPKGSDEESVQTFAERRLGAAMASRLVDPMVSGIYGGDPAKLSFPACFPQLHLMEQKYGSLVRGMLSGSRSASSRVLSLRGGLQKLTDTLAERLGGRLQLNKMATRISFGREVQVSFSDGTSIAADHLYLALPAWQLAKLLPIPTLSQIPFASLAAVSLGYRRQVLANRGFGYLVPAVENKQILGMIWDSEVFPQQNQHPQETRVTVLMGGTRRPELVDRSDEELLRLACEAMPGLKPDASLVVRARQAIPQYELGFSQRLGQIKQHLPAQCTLLGSSYHGVSINDCIHYSASSSH